MTKLSLDAKEIYSIFLTDLFLELHSATCCEIAWSSYVEEEALHSLRSRCADADERADISQRFKWMKAYAEQMSTGVMI